MVLPEKRNRQFGSVFLEQENVREIHQREFSGRVETIYVEKTKRNTRQGKTLQCVRIKRNDVKVRFFLNKTAFYLIVSKIITTFASVKETTNINQF